MATYDSPRSEVISDLQNSVGGYLAQQILAALDETGQGQADTIDIQTDWVPGAPVAPGTDILIVRPGAVSGDVAIPDGISALLFTGSTGVQATLSTNHDVAISLTDGADVIRIVSSDDTPDVISVDLRGGDDSFVGSANDQNFVVGGLGNDTMIGGNLADHFDVAQGSDSVDGGNGYDLAFVQGKLTDFTETFEDGVLTLTNKINGETTVLKDLEYVKFADGGVIINVDTEQGFAAASLYEVVLGRPADEAGHEFYSQMSGTELAQVADDMLHSDEFTSKFGDVDNLSDSQFLNVLYETAFGRAPDAEGDAYWLDKLANGLDRGEVAAKFAYSAEAQSKFDGVINFQHDDSAV